MTRSISFVEVGRVVVLGLLLGGCPSPEGGFASGEAPPADDDDTVGRAWIECPDGGCGLDLNVVEASGLPAPCADVGCVEDYLAFAAANPGVSVDPDVLEAQILAAMQDDSVPAPPLGDDLRGDLRLATDTAFLFEGLDERLLEVEEVARVETDWGREEHLVVRDPYVGSMAMVLLRPNGAGPFPGLVAAPGHGEEWHDMRDAHFGDELADASWAVLILDSRASGADEHETLVTRELLAAGRSFLGVRVYEQLLARKILRWRSEVHPDYIGVWGHSGGAVVANLTVWIEDRFAALISDLDGEYLNAQEGGPWLDETSLRMHLWYPAINDHPAVPVPAYRDAYGYPAGSLPMRQFLRSDVLGL